jgi:hypothetical protein
VIRHSLAVLEYDSQRYHNAAHRDVSTKERPACALRSCRCEWRLDVVRPTCDAACCATVQQQHCTALHCTALRRTVLHCVEYLHWGDLPVA